jgi:hypothetical protein
VTPASKALILCVHAHPSLDDIERALRADAAIPMDDPRVARAVRRERSLLRAHPELFLTCVASHRGAFEDAVRRWEEEQERRGATWLRPLRPSLVPLDAPLLEIRRGDALPDRAPPRYRLLYENRPSWGRFQFEDAQTGSRREIVVDDDASFTVLADAGDDVIAAGWIEDYAGIVRAPSSRARRLTRRSSPIPRRLAGPDATRTTRSRVL